MKKKGELQELAKKINDAGKHFFAQILRTFAVGRDKNGKLYAGSSNDFDSAQKKVAKDLGIEIVKSHPGKHAEEELMLEVPDLVAVGTYKRYPCGPNEHDCHGQLIEKGIEIDNID